jgi:hypothetical protein
MSSSKCPHNQTNLCAECEALLSLQTQWPSLLGERRLAQLAAHVRQTFRKQLDHLRLLSNQLATLPTPYWALLQADQAFLDVLSQELRTIAERGDALLLEEVRASFWVQHQRGQTTEVELTPNQRTIVLLVIPRLADVAQYKPTPKTPAERAYRQALPQVVQALIGWLVEGKTVARWQGEFNARQRALEALRAPPKKRQGGKRKGAGRPKGEPTRVLPLRVRDSLYLRLAALAQEADLPLSVFVEGFLEKQFPNK